MMRGYGIALVKNGVKLGTAGAKIQRIEYDRVVDGISKARVDLVTAGDNCCGQLAAVDHWNTDLLITTYNTDTGLDEVLWRGPVRKPTFRRGSVTIEATDVLSWLQVRMLEQAFDFVNEDTSDIFIDLATYALTKDPNHRPVYEFVRYLSGTTESRTIDTAALRMTWNVVTEMLTHRGHPGDVQFPVGLADLELDPADSLGQRAGGVVDDLLDRRVQKSTGGVVGLHRITM